MAKRKRYDDKFRASAVVMLEAAGYPANAHAVVEVAEHLHVPDRTLRRWFNGTNNPPPDDIVQQEKKDLADLFENAARIYLTHGTDPEVVAEVSGQASMTAAAIAVDKMQLLRGMPTEIISMIPDVVKALKAAGYEPAQVFNDLIAEAHREQAELSAADAGESP